MAGAVITPSTPPASAVRPGRGAPGLPHYKPIPRPQPNPWLLMLPLGIVLALLPPFTTAAVVIAIGGVAILLARPRWALYLLAFTVPYQGMLDVKVDEVSVSITEGVVALLLVAWLTQVFAGRAKPAAASPLLGIIAALLVSFALTVFVATDLNMAAKEMLKWVELAGVFLAGTSLLQTRRQRLTLLGWLLAAASSQALYGLYLSIRRDGPEHFMIGGAIMRAYGSFEQPNPFGGYMGLAVPLAVSIALFGLRPGPWRRAAFAAAGLTGFALLITLSRGAWVAQLVALMLVLMVSSPRARQAITAILLASVVLGAALWPLLPAEITERATSVVSSAVDIGSARNAIVTPENWAVLERLSQWYAGWEMFLNNPLLGVGIGNYNAAYDDYRLEQWPVALGHAHNHYLTIAAESGVLGFVFYVLFWAVAFRTCAAAIRSAPGPLERAIAVGILGCLAAFATHNLFDVLFVHGMGVTIGLLLTLLYGVSERPSTSTDTEPTPARSAHGSDALHRFPASGAFS